MAGAAVDKQVSPAPDVNRRGKRRAPVQGRSRNTVDCIKQAALELSREHGFQMLTTAGIAERAGVSIGSLYQYFSSREAVLLAIYEDVSLDLTLGTRQFADERRDRDLETSVHQIIAGILRLHEQHRLILIDLPRAFPELSLTTHPAGYDSMIRASIKAFVVDRVPGIDRAELEKAGFFLERIVLDSIRAWLRDSPAQPTRSVLIAGIAELVLSLLRWGKDTPPPTAMRKRKTPS